MGKRSFKPIASFGEPAKIRTLKKFGHMMSKEALCVGLWFAMARNFAISDQKSFGV